MREIQWQIIFVLDFSRTEIFTHNENYFVKQLSQIFYRGFFFKLTLTTWAEKNIYNLL